jgi:hypothetical protein
MPVLLVAELPEGYGTIVLGRHADKSLEQSVGHLAELLSRQYGEVPRIRRQRLFEFSGHLHVRPDPEHPHFDDDPLTDEILVERKTEGIVISGSDNTATRFAVYRFLEEFLGWRYYQPGPLGLEQLDQPPEPPVLSGETRVLLHEQAGFHSRSLSHIHNQAGSPDWIIWNGLRDRFQYNHSLHKVVTPDLFDSHSDWFAKDANGRPQRPPYAQPNGYNDHPDLTNPGVRDYVTKWGIKRLRSYLPENGKREYKQSPAVVSLSLSMADSFVFGHFEDSYKWKPEGYFRRWPDWGNHVFDYTNDITSRLEAYWDNVAWTNGQKPELFVGALSYLCWERPPDFQVHPAVVPYMTFDRSQWYDPAAMADDLSTIETWATKGTRVLGTWDYIFGYGFLMPRSLVSVTGGSIPAIHERGVRAYYSQVGPIWPYDGHTTWLTAKLLWNPKMDPADAIQEYHDEFFGPAAEAMKGFFDVAEHTWMNQDGGVSGTSWWLRFWEDPWQATLWQDSDLKTMGGQLDLARSLTSGPGDERFNQRVDQTAALFEATREFIDYERSLWLAQSGDLTVAAKALAHRRKLTELLQSTIAKHPVARTAGRTRWIHRYDGLGGVLARHLDTDEELISAPLREWCALQGFRGVPGTGQKRRVLYDTTGEHLENPKVWKVGFLDSPDADIAINPQSNVIQAKNIRRGYLYQPFKAEEGRFYLGSLDLETEQTPTGEVFIRVDFLDENLKVIAMSTCSRLAPTGDHGTKQSVYSLMQAPEGTYAGRLFIRFYELNPEKPVDLIRMNVHDLGPPQTP